MNTQPVGEYELRDDIALKLLDEVAKEPTVSQRALSARLDIALGLVNTYLKRLCKKGHLKVTTLPRNRIKYLITPQGFAEKARLTYSYMNISLNYIRDMRGRIERVYGSIREQGHSRILLWGDGEIAELCFVSTRGLPLEIVAVVSSSPGTGNDFFGRPVISPDGVAAFSFDVVVLASTDADFGNMMHTAGIAKEKVFCL